MRLGRALQLDDFQGNAPLVGGEGELAVYIVIGIWATVGIVDDEAVFVRAFAAAGGFGETRVGDFRGAG